MDRTPTRRLSYLGAVFLLLAPTLSLAEDATEGPRKPLVAHWSFDEAGSTARDLTGNLPAKLEEAPQVSWTRGVHGKALSLRGSHRLVTAPAPWGGELAEISFSAWVRPSDLVGHRNIFRQSGQRSLLADFQRDVLFNFQRDGAVLSLGLDIGGYVELDALIDTAGVVNGMWHHAAATFDGRFMRVYLDGQEVGALERSGTIATSSERPCFIGSKGGATNFFLGMLDDLRIYREALTPAEVAGLHQSGQDAMAPYLAELEAAIRAVYSPGESFAATLTATRRNLWEKEWGEREEIAKRLLPGLQADYREDYRSYSVWMKENPLGYLLCEQGEYQRSKAAEFVALLLEYRPLTESQCAKQSPEDVARWEEAEAIEAKYQKLVSLGEAARFDPGWMELIFEASRRIDFRPFVQERVAPYVTPETPVTRDLSAAEARAVLERDWLYQAGGDPTPARIRDEIRWARALAGKIQAHFPQRVDFSPQLLRLTRLGKEASSLGAADAALYFRVREVKREIVFGNPVVDFDKVLLVDMPYPQGKEWRHETRHRLGYMAVPGGRLLVLSGLSPAGHLEQLMPQPPLHGTFWRPDLSFDARKVVFCFKPHNEKAFHIWEIDVDGTGLVQLTEGPYDDLDPIYLPDEEHIIFSTTRGHTYVRCMPPTSAYPLARCDRDGENVYLISRNNEPDYVPSVLNDGRVVYTRWEYTDKPLWRAQGLWTMRPDGTQVNTLWGNQSVWPDLIKDARSIPGSRRVMVTGSAHHDWFSGSIAIIDPVKGYNFPAGLTKVTADVPYPESGNGPVDPIESPDYHASGDYRGYYSPYPLSEREFLVSADRRDKFVLYLMDVDGNRELIYEGVNNIFHAQPLKPRPRPAVIPDTVAWPGKGERLKPEGGVIFSSNVYQGAPAELRGKARYLRVLSIDHKTYTYWHKRPYISTGPVVSAVQSDGVKRVLGTVPIEEDGSVCFDAPAGIPLHFQLLDGEYRALHTMRSFTGVMPGERRGCLGCHELHSAAPEVETGSLALSRRPRKITAPPWGVETVSYERYVQPTLDKYCGKCHQGEGEARKTLDLTSRPGFLMFDETYMILTGRPAWGSPYKKPEKPEPGLGIANTIMVEAYGRRDPLAYKTPPAMTYLSYRSKLIEIASSGKHHDVQVDPVSLRRLMLWVDTMCPYRGDDEVRAIADPVFQGVDWLAVRPRIKSAPRIVRPGPVD